jgi:hypothetical protein
MCRDAVGGKNTGRLNVEEEAQGGDRRMDAVKSPSTLGWSPSAKRRANASLAKGRSSASTIGLGAPLRGLRIVERAGDRNGRLSPHGGQVEAG